MQIVLIPIAKLMSSDVSRVASRRVADLPEMLELILVWLFS